MTVSLNEIKVFFVILFSSVNGNGENNPNLNTHTYTYISRHSKAPASDLTWQLLSYHFLILLNSDHISPKEPLFSLQPDFSPHSILLSLFLMPSIWFEYNGVCYCVTDRSWDCRLLFDFFFFFSSILLISLPAPLIQCLHWENSVLPQLICGILYREGLHESVSADVLYFYMLMFYLSVYWSADWTLLVVRCDRTSYQ